MENFMENNHIILILILGCIGSWIGLGIVIYHICKYSSQELQMINEIKQELKIVKEEVKELK
jgi:hypothetical protein